MSTKHTPGPWQLADNDIVVGRDRTIRKIVTVSKSSFGKKIPEYRNNAFLIAAAPEMLEALRETRAILAAHCLMSDPTDKGGAAMRVIDAAISKAEGRK